MAQGLTNAIPLTQGMHLRSHDGRAGAGSISGSFFASMPTMNVADRMSGVGAGEDVAVTLSKFPSGPASVVRDTVYEFFLSAD